MVLQWGPFRQCNWMCRCRRLVLASDTIRQQMDKLSKMTTKSSISILEIESMFRWRHPRGLKQWLCRICHWKNKSETNINTKIANRCRMYYLPKYHQHAHWPSSPKLIHDEPAEKIARHFNQRRQEKAKILIGAQRWSIIAQAQINGLICKPI